MKTPTLRPLTATVLLAAASTLPAAELCPLRDASETAGADAIEASADHFVARINGRSRLSGAAQFRQNDNRLRAERIDYDPNARRVQASGNVRYTNCDTKKPAWFLSADRFTLDRKTNTGTAKNAWLVVGNTPLLYLPRYHVSLENRRKSGFLTPEIGESSETGAELAFPYYFNLAPNHDVTLEPRFLSKRGVQFAGKYRYLRRFSEGTLKGDWLSDNDYDNNGDDERYSYSLRHQTRAGDKLRVQLHLQKVSDSDYIEDLSSSFDLIDENYLNSKILADYVWRGWHLNLAAENFQRTDNDARRETRLYERHPSVALSKNLYSPHLNLDLGLRTEWTDFNRKYDAPDMSETAEGERLDSEITLRWPYRRPGFHFTPSVALRHTDYTLDRRPDESRTLPWFSLRTGLVFEKNIHQQRYRHTIEPELFYLHVPRRDQSDFPVFDTGASEFRFSQLFEENRFNGADRVGDADQLTLALSSRLIHARSGREALRFSVGHTSYFRNRDVGLPDEDLSTNRYDYSNLTSEFALNLNEKLKFTSSLIWDTERELPARHAVRLSLNAGNNKIISLSNRYRRGDEGFSQSEIGFHLPLGTRWRWFGGWRYDLRENEDIGVMTGLRYDTCCWSLRLAGQRLLSDIDGADKSIANGSLDYNTRIGIEFSLRGLATLGTNTGSGLIEKWISDYRKR